MTLDHFEQALLTDLRSHVAERGVTAAPAARHSRRWRWAAVPAGAAAAVGVAVTLALQPAAAYAVTDSSGDVVVVSISRLDDATGLEKALAEHGITADVEYTATSADLPPNGPGPSVEPGTSQTGPSLQGSGPAPEVTARPVVTSSLDKDGLTLRIDKDTLPADDVLTITTSGSADSGPAGLQVMFTHNK